MHSIAISVNIYEAPYRTRTGGFHEYSRLNKLKFIGDFYATVFSVLPGRANLPSSIVILSSSPKILLCTRNQAIRPTVKTR